VGTFLRHSVFIRRPANAAVVMPSVASVSVCVCLSCSCSYFRKPWPKNFILVHRYIFRNLGQLHMSRSSGQPLLTSLMIKVTGKNGTKTGYRPTSV